DVDAAGRGARLCRRRRGGRGLERGGETRHDDVVDALDELVPPAARQSHGGEPVPGGFLRARDEALRELFAGGLAVGHFVMPGGYVRLQGIEDPARGGFGGDGGEGDLLTQQGGGVVRDGGPQVF